MSKSASNFGAPTSLEGDHFRVEIPSQRSQAIAIVEVYGTLPPEEEPRAFIERRVWLTIADVAQREFNARLRAAKLRQGRWHTGTNYLDRLLGRELCILAWAAEQASDTQISTICRKWLALRPEERWWLFLKTVAEAGCPEDRDRGWRRALYFALSDAPPTTPRSPRPTEPQFTELPLFSLPPRE